MKDFYPQMKNSISSDHTTKSLRIIIITGLSGAGKSTALNILEDMGYYCMDNLPCLLLSSFIEMAERSDEEIDKVAIVMDTRKKDFIIRFPEVFEEIKKKGYGVSLIFLEAEKDVLKKRFFLTRRPHPFQREGTIDNGIEQEILAYRRIKDMADFTIDTSDRSPKELKERLSFLLESLHQDIINVTLISFGFIFEPPKDADMVIDVRFLPNPYFIESMRNYTGKDTKIKRFLRSKPVYSQFIRMTFDLLNLMIEEYRRAGKNYFTVAFGCTGGKHRSPAVVEDLFRRMTRKRYNLSIIHRDIDK